MLIMPYADTSEPRYAEIARLMATTHDWITPWFEPNMPFWGKPPLSFWLQALSIKWLGTSEFSARLPAWLANVGITYLIVLGATAYYETKQKLTPQLGLIAAIIYNSCTLSYVAAVAVLTDIYLCLGVTLSLVAMLCVTPKKRYWGYIFFLGLSVGALAKGPLALVFIATPLVLAYFGHDGVMKAKLKRLPWASGLLLFCALTLPWYVAAEIKTPGFLHYFIVGEHLQRFIDSGWQGDLYGTAHQKPRGAIWWLWLQSTFPWGPLAVIFGLIALYKQKIVSTFFKHSLSIYLLTAALLSPVFFTLAGNILWTYNLPSLAPFALLFAWPVYHYSIKIHPARRVIVTSLSVPLAGVALSLFVYLHPNYVNTEKQLINYVSSHTTATAPLYYVGALPFSARFYSQGQVHSTDQAALLNPRHSPRYVAVPLKTLNALPTQVWDNYTVVFQNKRYALLYAISQDN